jgi:hypothetical protein
MKNKLKDRRKDKNRLQNYKKRVNLTFLLSKK